MFDSHLDVLRPDYSHGRAFARICLTNSRLQMKGTMATRTIRVRTRVTTTTRVRTTVRITRK